MFYCEEAQRRLLLVALIILLTLNCLATGNERGSQVFELTEATFDQYTRDKDVMLVEFYMPWCRHCQALQPEWEKAGQILAENREYILGKVNCWEAGKSLCDKLKIAMYPDIRLYRHGQVAESYEGEREAGAILDFVQRAQATTGTVGSPSPAPQMPIVAAVQPAAPSAAQPPAPVQLPQPAGQTPQVAVQQASIPPPPPQQQIAAAALLPQQPPPQQTQQQELIVDASALSLPLPPPPAFARPPPSRLQIQLQPQAPPQPQAQPNPPTLVQLPPKAAAKPPLKPLLPPAQAAPPPQQARIQSEQYYTTPISEAYQAPPGAINLPVQTITDAKPDQEFNFYETIVPPPPGPGGNYQVQPMQVQPPAPQQAQTAQYVPGPQPQPFVTQEAQQAAVVPANPLVPAPAPPAVDLPPPLPPVAPPPPPPAPVQPMETYNPNGNDIWGLNKIFASMGNEQQQQHPRPPSTPEQLLLPPPPQQQQAPLVEQPPQQSPTMAQFNQPTPYKNYAPAPPRTQPYMLPQPPAAGPANKAPLTNINASPSLWNFFQNMAFNQPGLPTNPQQMLRDQQKNKPLQNHASSAFAKQQVFDQEKQRADAERKRLQFASSNLEKLEKLFADVPQGGHLRLEPNVLEVEQRPISVVDMPPFGVSNSMFNDQYKTLLPPETNQLGYFKPRPILRHPISPLDPSEAFYPGITRSNPPLDLDEGPGMAPKIPKPSMYNMLHRRKPMERFLKRPLIDGQFQLKQEDIAPQNYWSPSIKNNPSGINQHRKLVHQQTQARLRPMPPRFLTKAIELARLHSQPRMQLVVEEPRTDKALIRTKVQRPPPNRRPAARRYMAAKLPTDSRIRAILARRKQLQNMRLAKPLIIARRPFVKLKPLPSMKVPNLKARTPLKVPNLQNRPPPKVPNLKGRPPPKFPVLRPPPKVSQVGRSPIVPSALIRMRAQKMYALRHVKARTNPYVKAGLPQLRVRNMAALKTPNPKLRVGNPLLRTVNPQSKNPVLQKPVPRKPALKPPATAQLKDRRLPASILRSNARLNNALLRARAIAAAKHKPLPKKPTTQLKKVPPQFQMPQLKNPSLKPANPLPQLNTSLWAKLLPRPQQSLLKPAKPVLKQPINSHSIAPALTDRSNFLPSIHLKESTLLAHFPSLLLAQRSKEEFERGFHAPLKDNQKTGQTRQEVKYPEPKNMAGIWDRLYNFYSKKETYTKKSDQMKAAEENRLAADKSTINHVRNFSLDSPAPPMKKQKIRLADIEAFLRQKILNTDKSPAKNNENKSPVHEDRKKSDITPRPIVSTLKLDDKQHFLKAISRDAHPWDKRAKVTFQLSRKSDIPGRPKVVGVWGSLKKKKKRKRRKRGKKKKRQVRSAPISKRTHFLEQSNPQTNWYLNS